MFIKRRHDEINKNEKRRRIDLCTLTVGEYIKGIHFPANKRELSEKIKQHNAPKNIKALMTLFPEKVYGSLDDIEREELNSRSILISLNNVKVSFAAPLIDSARAYSD